MNVTNSKRISALYNTNEPAKWVGKTIQLCAETGKNPQGEVIPVLRVREVIPAPPNPVRALNQQVRKALADYDGLGKDDIKNFLRQCQVDKKTNANLYRQTISVLTTMNEKQKASELTDDLFKNLFEDLKTYA